MEKRLYNITPESFQEVGIIRPYSAAYSVKYRTEVMALFKAGFVHILICTDAAGMVCKLSVNTIQNQGCNIPNIDIVVQWKWPVSVLTFVQRAGRAARGPGRTGLAVLLVEKSVYEADLSCLESAFEGKKSKKGKGVRQSSMYPKATKQYAISRGLLRGAYGGGTCDEILKRDEIALDRESMDEGLYTLVQTGKCRRKVLTTVFNNTNPCKCFSN